MGIAVHICGWCGAEFLALLANKRKFCGYDCAYSGRRFVHPNPKTHGKSRTRIYAVWFNMLDRCRNPDNAAYANYGGRGISVCDEWQKFEAFYADMGDRPSSKHSIERIDNEGNYERSNCKWATAVEQNRNKRNVTGYWERRNQRPIAALSRQSGGGPCLCSLSC